MKNEITFNPGELLCAPGEIMDFAEGKECRWAQ
jgi:hypothetical protein